MVFILIIYDITNNDMPLYLKAPMNYITDIFFGLF